MCICEILSTSKEDITNRASVHHLEVDLVQRLVDLATVYGRCGQFLRIHYEVHRLGWVGYLSRVCDICMYAWRLPLQPRDSNSNNAWVEGTLT